MIIYDTETTGLKANDFIIELAAQKYRVEDGVLVNTDTLHLYLKPPFEVSGKITEITGITNEQLSDKPSFETQFSQIKEFFDGIPVCGYNIGFDIKMMRSEYERCGDAFNPPATLDVLTMARRLLGNEVENHQLGTVAKYLGVDEGIVFHSAIQDTEATKLVFEKLKAML